MYVIPFATMDQALDALRAWAEQNNLHPWELLDCWYVGTTFKQINDPAFNERVKAPILVAKGLSETLPSTQLPHWLGPIAEVDRRPEP